jgi:hypothetical protein
MKKSGLCWHEARSGSCLCFHPSPLGQARHDPNCVARRSMMAGPLGHDLGSTSASPPPTAYKRHYAYTLLHLTPTPPLPNPSLARSRPATPPLRRSLLRSPLPLHPPPPFSATLRPHLAAHQPLPPPPDTSTVGARPCPLLISSVSVGCLGLMRGGARSRGWI